MNSPTPPATGFRHADRIDLAACLLLVVACTVAKLAWLEPAGPLIFFDELLYRQGAQALAGQGLYPSGHYPFLYPALLAPAEAMGWGYFGFFVANVLSTSMLIPACWLLGRTAGLRWGWPCALAAALLPLQWVFPTQLMSENLFVPLFAWTAWYAIRAKIPGALASFAYGVALASLFLVKYLALPAIPVIWAVWLYGIGSNPAMNRSTLWRPALASLVGMVAMDAAWIAYASFNGIGVAEAFGAKVSGLNAGELMTPAVVLMWASAYLGTLVLLSAPFLPRFAEGLGQLAGAPLRLLREQPVARLLLLCALLVGGYWLICVQHSAGAIYNYPVPQRVIARYFMHLTPLLVVLGIALTLAPLRRSRLAVALPLAVLVAVATWLAHGVLYADLVWDLPKWFASIPLYTSDILGYRPPELLWFLVGLVLAGGLVGLHRALAWAWVLALLVLLGMASQEVHRHAVRDSSTRPLHARTLAPMVIKVASEHGEVLVITELGRERPSTMRQALVFWGADPQTFRVIGPGQEQAARSREVEVLRITGERRGTPALQYRAGKETGYIYREHFEGNGGIEKPAGGATLQVTPAFACVEGTPSTATVSWDARESGADRVMVYIRTGDGGEKLFTGAPPQGQRPTGPWAMPGMTFRLRASRTGLLLAETTIQARDCG